MGSESHGAAQASGHKWHRACAHNAESSVPTPLSAVATYSTAWHAHNTARAVEPHPGVDPLLLRGVRFPLFVVHGRIAKLLAGARLPSPDSCRNAGSGGRFATLLPLRIRLRRSGSDSGGMKGLRERAGMPTPNAIKMTNRHSDFGRRVDRMVAVVLGGCVAVTSAVLLCFGVPAVTSGVPELL